MSSQAEEFNQTQHQESLTEEQINKLTTKIEDKKIFQLHTKLIIHLLQKAS